ncbi:MAG: tripartite tricarboxylate transporter permease [Candidatus Njordarchaeota archaeon]
MDIIIGLVYIILGVLVGGLISILPSVHIYNIAPLFIIFAPSIGIPPEALLFFLLGNVIGFAIINTISIIFFSAPDDTTFLILSPTQLMLANGRAFEAAILMGIGGLVGALLLAAVSPLLFLMMPTFMSVITPHLHWILALFMFYILLSEFPKDIGTGTSKVGRFMSGWRNLAAGYLTFFLSAILGFIIMNSGIIPVEAAYFGLLPAFIGLFAIPSLIMNVVSRTRAPEQRIQKSIDASMIDVIKGGLAGFSGGLFAAVFPALTGGMGSLIAGQATGEREESQFIMSMATSRFVYYVGAFFLLFIPGYTVVRGGLANLASTVYIPQKYSEFYVAVAGIALGGVIAFLLLIGVSYLIAKYIHKMRYDYFSIAIIVVLAVIVYLTTGIIGILIMFVSTGIGLIPLLFGSRRLHCLAVILFPLMLNMAGLSAGFAKFIGLR